MNLDENDEDDNKKANLVLNKNQRRRKIRSIIPDHLVSEETKRVAKEEEQKKIVLEQRKKNSVDTSRYNGVLINPFHPPNEPNIPILNEIAKRLKPHQLHSVRWLWDVMIASLPEGTNSISLYFYINIYF